MAATAALPRSGISLLEALLGVGEPITSKCDGEVKCDACHVFVPVGRKSL